MLSDAFFTTVQEIQKNSENVYVQHEVVIFLVAGVKRRFVRKDDEEMMMSFAIFAFEFLWNRCSSGWVMGLIAIVFFARC